ncbi:MAG: alkaline phosphatase [Pirellulaceae bacterium]
MTLRWFRGLLGLALFTFAASLPTAVWSEESDDHVRQVQTEAITGGSAAWGHWGPDPARYSSWTTHSNRMIPIYTFGIDLESVRGENSVYRSEEKLKQLYGTLPENTLNAEAEYFDQTDVYHLQKLAVEQGKKRIILVVFDGLDWQTTWATATHASGKVGYAEGRGTGLHFQDYRGTKTDFGYFVTAPHNDGTKIDVDAQRVENPGGTKRGGYDWKRAGDTPWATWSTWKEDPKYLIGGSKEVPHPYVDSAASATAMTAGIKTYNASINIDPQGNPVPTIAHQLQEIGFAVGAVSSVPIAHATPACAYAHNVHRNDYQDITRDLLGLPSIARRNRTLPGLDVLIGTGWGVEKEKDKGQGENFISGNTNLADQDAAAVDIENGGKYVVVQRTEGQNGTEALKAATQKAIQGNHRLLGYFGTTAGHLPYATASGNYHPTVSVGRVSETLTTPGEAEEYDEADISENPTLEEMTQAGLDVLAAKSDSFWLLVEAGDVDWANHANNIDNSIGATLSGDAAFRVVTDWVETNGGWEETAVIVTADHGHYLVLNQPEALLPTE